MSNLQNDNNSAVRGYILRSLVRGLRFSVSAVELSNKLVACGLMGNNDISNHLYYLEDCGFIKFTDNSISAFNALENDGIVRLTSKGIRFIENGGEPEMGIDL